MSEFHFIHPWRLLGLLICGLLWLVNSAQRSAWLGIMDKPFARALIIDRHRPLAQILPWLFAAGVIALAGPSWQRELPAELTPESNVMVILQQDPAMNARDLAPSRHQRMQSKIASLMDRSPGARFGLVVYNDQPYLTTPLTQVPDFYRLFLDAQNPALLPTPEGQALTSGLPEAVALAKKNMPDSPRTLILVADTLSPADASWLAANPDQLQIWVPGTAAGGPMPEKYADQAIDTKLNVDRFSQVRSAGIPVTLVTGDDSDLDVISSHIQQSVSKQNNARGDLHWHNSGYWLVIPMLLLLLVWRHQILCIGFMVPLLMWSPDSHAAWLDAWVRPDVQGQHAFNNGEYDRAARHFMDPLWQGIAFYRAGNFPAATGAFRLAPQTAEALLWTGNSYAQQKKWQQAINSYDQALSLKPEWPMALQNREKVARIIMAIRQQERERQQAQGKDMDDGPDKIVHDLKKDQGYEQKEMHKLASSSPQIGQWYQNLSVSPAGLLESLYRSAPQETPAPPVPDAATGAQP